MAESLIVQGNEACVLGALAAGCSFFAGYPITPASEIAELMSRDLPGRRGVFVQMEDEIASISAVIGASWGGRLSCTATSGPGFSLMQEGIGYAAETETPCVIIDVQRGGPSTGQPTMSAQQDLYQAKYGSHGDYEVIALCPSSVQEAFELTYKAFGLAERFRTPVILLSDEIVGHTREKLKIPDNLKSIQRKFPQASPLEYQMYQPGPDGLLDGMPMLGKGYNILVDGQLHDETGNRKGGDIKASAKLVERLCNKITNHTDELVDLEARSLEDADEVFVCLGPVARSAQHAVNLAREKGLKAGCLKLRTLWPFPDENLRRLLTGAKRVLMPEMNIGKLCREVRRVLPDYVQVVSLPKLGGDLHTPYELVRALGAPPKKGFCNASLG
jgi:2-oxoglutarate ferredoxin oxidoreductase subunit alpha